MLSLETDRLILHPFEEKDGEILHNLFTDPFIRKYLWDDVILSPQQSKEVHEQNIKRFQEDRWGLWKIQEKGSPEIMGFVGLWYFFEEPQPQLLYALLEKHTGKGFAREGAKRILQYAFESLNFGYLIASMDEPQVASQKLAKGIGMKFVEKKIEEGKATVFYRIDKTDHT